MLMAASKEGKVSVVKRLLEERTDIDVNERDDRGWTPCMWASSNGHHVVVDLLLQHNAKVNAADPFYQFTSMHLACKHGHDLVVYNLLKVFPDLHAKNINKRECRDLATGNVCVEEVL